MKTFNEIATAMYENLTTSKRADGSEFTHMKEDIDWQRDIIFGAHLDRMPSDDIYSRIEDILSVLSECEDAEEAQERIYDIEPDCYTSDLTAWLNSDNRNVYYLDEAIEQGCSDGFGLLAAAQFAYIKEIANALISGIIEYIESAA